MKNIKHLSIIFILFFLTELVYSQSNDSSVVGINGQLSVEGKYIVNQYNEPIVLRGMSLFWSQWMGQYYNASAIQWLKEDWNCTVVRAAMGIEMGGYLEHPTTEMSKIKKVVDACIEDGIYVIVDWHDHHAEDHEEEAINFFTEIASLYGDYPNIIYEIYNEPLQISWTNIVKPYSERVITAIREIDSNNVILVGSPTWSQDVDTAANNPIESENIAYSLHYYAATHKQSLRDKAQTAISKGLPLFVSEFGTCESSGDGVLDYEETETWFDFLEDNKIGWCNWSIADKDETASALKPGASGLGGWSESQLTPSGKLIRDKILELNRVTSIKLELENSSPKINSIENYPNPFNSSTTVSFSLTQNSKIKMSVFNINGENVINLIEKDLGRGNYSFPINFSRLPSGNYFLRYQSDQYSGVLKLQHLK